MNTAAEQATEDPTRLAALAPLNIIRTETVLSKLPVHNLSKKGKVDIRIVKRDSSGEVHLKWEVSHSDRYGQPRQLAYKLDTLIVNRRIDDEVRPLKPIIRIGSLKEICKELGLNESGKNTRDLRTSFLQNASAFINAVLTYRGTDGIERTLESGFTRYGVIFTGDRLPDGRQADAVYITLNQPYRDVLESAPVRPLNYDYLRELTPGAQRFYEVISFRIYAALKNGRLQAKLLYSDYCAFSAQQRYFDYEHFRVQMYKIHKPHLSSGYLKSVVVEPATDGEGKSDWMMIYTPGPKAKAEFATFSKKQRIVEQSATEPLPAISNDSPPPVPAAGEALIRELTNRGITESRARKLLRTVAPDQHVIGQLEWGDHLLHQSPSGTFRNPPGFYFSLVRDNISPPDTFETSYRRKLREDAQRAHIEQYEAERELERLYDAYVAAEVEKAFSAMLETERRAEVSAKRKTYARQFPNLLPSTLDQIAEQAVRAALKDKLPLLTLSQFSKNHSGHKDHKGQKFLFE